jgi:hypothetical protein
MLDALVQPFVAHADIGHLAMLIMLVGLAHAWRLTFRELTAANRRFDDFVRELAHFNQAVEKNDP